MIKEKFPYFFLPKNIFFTLSELFQIINNKYDLCLCRTFMLTNKKIFIHLRILTFQSKVMPSLTEISKHNSTTHSIPTLCEQVPTMGGVNYCIPTTYKSLSSERRFLIQHNTTCIPPP